MGKFTDSFLGQMMSENRMPSSKRWAAAITTATLQWVIVYSTLKANNASERLAIIWATISFIIVLLGIATMPQIISFIKGTPIPKEEIKEDIKQD